MTVNYTHKLVSEVTSQLKKSQQKTNKKINQQHPKHNFFWPLSGFFLLLEKISTAIFFFLGNKKCIQVLESVLRLKKCI